MSMKKTFIFYAIFLSAVLIFGICRGMRLANDKSRLKDGVFFAGLKQGNLLDGTQWRMLDTMSLSDAERMDIKSSILRLLWESSYMSGNPISQPKGTFLESIRYINNYYQKEEARILPVFFVFKMSVMQAEGSTPPEIEAYKSLVIANLKRSRLL